MLGGLASFFLCISKYLMIFICGKYPYFVENMLMFRVVHSLLLLLLLMMSELLTTVCGHIVCCSMKFIRWIYQLPYTSPHLASHVCSLRFWNQATAPNNLDTLLVIFISWCFYFYRTHIFIINKFCAHFFNSLFTRNRSKQDECYLTQKNDVSKCSRYLTEQMRAWRMEKKWERAKKICCRLKCVMECKSGGGDGDGGV